jgi:hypothetical protein
VRAASGIWRGTWLRVVSSEEVTPGLLLPLSVSA